MLMSGYINDAGFAQTSHNGLVKAETELGITGAYTEAVPQPDYEAVMRDYADQGFDLVICVGNEFSDAALKVAPSFTDTKFAVINGNDCSEPNMGAFRFNTPQTGFLAGSLAAMYSKAGVVGCIGGSTYPHIKDGVNAFEAGAKYVNPDINVLTGFTESFTDIAKAKEMGMAFLEQGADVLSANADSGSLGVIDAVKDKSAIYIGYINDQHDVAPDRIPVSVMQSNEFMVYSIIKSVVDGTFTPTLHLMGMNEGAISVGEFYDVAATLSDARKAKIKEIVAGIEDGSLKTEGILPKSSFEV